MLIENLIVLVKMGFIIKTKLVNSVTISVGAAVYLQFNVILVQLVIEILARIVHAKLIFMIQGCQNVPNANILVKLVLLRWFV